MVLTSLTAVAAGASPGSFALSNASPTTTVLGSAPNPAAFGATVTLTATVTSGAGTPTGTVQLLDGAALLGSDDVDGAGVASLDTTTVALVSTKNPAHAGTSVRFTARVSFYTRLCGIPTGTIQLRACGANLRLAVPVVSAQASSQPCSMPDHACQVTATYSGSGYFAASAATLELILSP